MVGAALAQRGREPGVRVRIEHASGTPAILDMSVDWNVYVTAERPPDDAPVRGRVTYAAELKHVVLFVE
jgi:hypothetical protein